MSEDQKSFFVVYTHGVTVDSEDENMARHDGVEMLHNELSQDPELHNDLAETAVVVEIPNVVTELDEMWTSHKVQLMVTPGIYIWQCVDCGAVNGVNTPESTKVKCRICFSEHEIIEGVRKC